MIEFTKLLLSDISKVRKYFLYSTTRICDNTVGGAFMWRDYFSVEYAEYNETIIFKAKVKYHNDITAFSMPLGKDMRGAISQIAEYCRTTGAPLAFCTVTEADVEVLRSLFPEFLLFKATNWSDYIYKASDLATLSGRRYSGKRNHINHFKMEYGAHTFEELSGENLEDAIEFHSRLGSDSTNGSELYVEEHITTREVLDNFDSYGLFGGLLRVHGAVAAFSVGEIINDVLFVHIEKADMRFRGAYQVVNNEFAKRFATSSVEFVNREDDAGDEGLRISKVSYHPFEIIDKYIFLVE